MNPSPVAARFASAHARARIVKILLIACAVASGMSLVAESLSLAFPPLTDDQELGDNPISAALMALTFLIAVLDLIIYLTTAVFFLIWLYRAYDNVRALNPSRRLENSPGWTIGSFFIPIANLFVPYRGVKEVWQKSGPPDEGLLVQPAEVPARFPIWWMFWLLASFASNASMRVSFDEDVPLNDATMVSIVANALFIVASAFAYLVVDAIDKRQEETSAKIGLRFSGPPPPPVDFQPI